MSSQCTPGLPPPIVDRNSGKVYIAIPAPAFVCSPLSNHSLHETSFVYIESKSPGSQRMFTPEQTKILSHKPPVNKWVDGIRDSFLPPNHVPWTSQLEFPATESITSLAGNYSSSRPTSIACSGTTSQFSLSDIPFFNSGSTLLNGSLPSTCSSIFSESVIPPFEEVKASAKKSGKLMTPPASRTSSAATVRERRKTTCFSNFPRSREAHVHIRRSVPDVVVNTTLGHSFINEGLKKEKEAEAVGMQKLADLDVFLSDGLDAMDSDMLLLSRQKEELEAPSLVISTSNAVIPLSLESSTDIKEASSLAQRRGKVDLGPLKINVPHEEALYDYQDVPTPFRGSPNPAVMEFPLPPSTVKKASPPQITTEQMISSLRAHVNVLKPSSTDLLEACDNAMEWLNDELNEEPATFAKELKEFTPDADRTLTPSYAKARSRSFTESSAVPRMSCGPIVHGMQRLGPFSPSAAAYFSTGTRVAGGAPKKPSFSSLRRATVSTSSGTSDREKKVRFSQDPPTTIPLSMLEGDPVAVEFRAVESAQSQPPKRKPPPPLPVMSPKLPVHYLSPAAAGPVKGENANRTRSVAALGPPPSKPPPPAPTPLPIRRRASDIVPPAMPMFKPGNELMRTSLDGACTPRKAKSTIRVSELLGSRKKVNENSRSGLKNEVKLDAKAPKTPKTRGLPFQNVLNRFRT